jgi:hypothetical protein
MSSLLWPDDFSEASDDKQIKARISFEKVGCKNHGKNSFARKKFESIDSIVLDGHNHFESEMDWKRSPSTASTLSV